MALGGLSDLWLNHTASWSPAVVAMIDNVLATSMWKRYVGYICCFRDYCWKCGHDFPLAESEAVGVIASFFESTTRVGQRPGATLASMSAAITMLYEPTGSSPTRAPLLTRLHRAIVRARTTRPIENGQVFDVRALRDLFLKWGDRLSLWQLRSKLLTMLCILGVLRVASTVLPGLKDANVETVDRLKFLKIQIIGHKNNNGDGKTVTLHQSSNDLCCPVQTFKEWKRLHPLAPGRSPHPAQERAPAEEDSFRGRPGSQHTFRKLGVMAGLHAGIKPNAIFRLGGWRSAETFWSHYMVRQVPHSYTDLLFDTGQDSSDDDKAPWE
jgi:hypothetical protein